MNSEGAHNNQLPDRDQVSRKPYFSPQLVEYGKLEDLTVGGVGNVDDLSGGSFVL